MIDIVICDKCNSSLATHGTVHALRVEPCKKCLTDEKEKGYINGYKACDFDIMPRSEIIT